MSDILPKYPVRLEQGTGLDRVVIYAIRDGVNTGHKYKKNDERLNDEGLQVRILQIFAFFNSELISVHVSKN